jgi:hypothetical protein
VRPFALLTVPSFVGLVACGSPAAQAPPSRSTGPAVAASAAPPRTEASAEPSPAAVATSAEHLPSACDGRFGDICVPPGRFIERLCTKAHQDVALALFAKASPFTRLYLKGKLDELQFDEEVLALRLHVQPKGGMIVGSGNGTYDVLRWDGSCSVGVEAEVLTRVRPPTPRAARVQWHRVGEKTQSALISGSDAVKRAHARRGKECKGAMSGDVSAACEKADATLADAVVDYVRKGGVLPEPDVP